MGDEAIRIVRRVPSVSNLLFPVLGHVKERQVCVATVFAYSRSNHAFDYQVPHDVKKRGGILVVEVIVCVPVRVGAVWIRDNALLAGQPRDYAHELDDLR